MKKRALTPNYKGDRVKHERDPIPWRYCLLTLICGLILVGGFFYAARQHFSAMDFGIKNAKLRQSRENLESEQRRLYLTKEISLSPSEIKKVAKKIGLQDLTARSIEMISPKKVDADVAKKSTETNTKPLLTDKPQIAKVVKEKNKDGEDKTVLKPTPKTTQNSSGTLDRPRIAKK